MKHGCAPSAIACKIRKFDKGFRRRRSAVDAPRPTQFARAPPGRLAAPHALSFRKPGTLPRLTATRFMQTASRFMSSARRTFRSLFPDARCHAVGRRRAECGGVALLLEKTGMCLTQVAALGAAPWAGRPQKTMTCPTKSTYPFWRIVRLPSLSARYTSGRWCISTKGLIAWAEALQCFS